MQERDGVAWWCGIKWRKGRTEEKLRGVIGRVRSGEGEWRNVITWRRIKVGMKGAKERRKEGEKKGREEGEAKRSYWKGVEW